MPNILTDLEFDELSIVDKGANVDSKVVLIKRRDEFVEVAKMYADGEIDKTDFMARFQEIAEQEKAWQMTDKLWPMYDALRMSLDETAKGYKGDERMRKVEDNVAMFKDMVKAVLMQDDEPPVEKTSGSPGSTHENPQENAMDIEALEKRLGELETELAGRDSVLKSLTEQLEAQGITLKYNDGEVSIEKRAEPEYIEFKGEKIEKSAVPAPVLKALEESEAAIAKMAAENERVELQKRASETIPSLCESDDDRIALMKALATIEDDETRDRVSKALETANKTTEELFKSRTVSGDENFADDGYAEVQKRAEELVKAGEFDNVVKARVHLLKSAEGQELLAKARQSH